jgi:transcription termination factor NusB
MWSYSLRFCLFFCIYQSLFQLSIGIPFAQPDYDKFFDTVLSEYPGIFELDSKDDSTEIDEEIQEERVEAMKAELFVSMEYFFANYDQFQEILKGYLSNWSKTFDIIKAIICCFLIEKNICSNDPELEKLFSEKGVGTYIKLSEEFTVLANVKLVHAVLSKLSPKQS